MSGNSSATLNGAAQHHNSITVEARAPHNYHPENIAGKTAIVTGGTTGIGRAIARLLAERGARVLIFGRDQNDLNEALQALKSCGEVHGLSADQAKVEEVQRIFQEADTRLGRIDILINNAAVSPGSVLESSLEEIAYGVNANLVGYLACAQQAIARMKNNPSTQSEGDISIKGYIINIGSLSAEAREEGNDVYVATKAGIQAFSEALRKSANAQGIKVSLIEPGLVESDMTTEDKTPEETAEQQRKATMIFAEDIAEAVHYILTQPARTDVINVQIRPHCQLI